MMIIKVIQIHFRLIFLITYKFMEIVFESVNEFLEEKREDFYYLTSTGV